MLIATLLDQAEVLQVVAAALRGTVALVPLDQEPEAGQAQVIELRASGLAIPIVLLGRLEGEPVAGMYPVRFKPLSGSHASDLRAFLRGGGTWPATPTPVHAVEPAQPGQTGTPGTYRVGAGREPAVVIPPAPTGTVREPLVPIDTLTDQARDASPLELVFGAPAREPSGITAAPPRREDALSDVASLASAAGTARASAGVPPPIPADAVGPASEETADFVGEPITTTDLTRPPVDDDRTIVEPATVGAEPTPSPPRTAQATPPRPPEPAERERTFQGRVLSGGKYFLQQHIGSGGSGRVYKAYHRELETTIAIKLLHELRQEDDRFAARFRREALATSKLDHANVMRVMDFGREQDGLLYIVMEYLDGPNLQRIIDLEAPLPLPRIVAIMSQVCAALAAAHHIGLIHRDMKPENVVIMQRRDDDGTATDVVKVCDFGLAKIQEPRGHEHHKSSGNLTIAGTVWGTPEYMSPEQIRNELLDPRSDVYSCGVILYEMATGQLPFRGETAIDIVTKHVVAEPVPPSKLVPSMDPRLEAVILRALAKERDDRQQSARDLRAELRGLLDPDARASASGSGWQPTSASPPEEGVFEDSVAKTTPHVRLAALAHEIVDRVGRRAAPSSVEEVIDSEGTMRAGDALDLALGILARQGNVTALWTLVEWLHHVARDPEGEAEPRQRAIATRALQTVAEADTLAEPARILLTGPPELHAPARDVLVTLGAAGAQALCTARLAAPLPPADRARFVEAMRAMGTSAMAALGATLADLDPARADREPQLAEDLLRAVPPDSSEVVAQLVIRHVRSRAPGVRRAAVEALGLVLGPHAREALWSLVQDPDVAIRIAAFAGLRRIGGVDEAVVDQVDRILTHEPDEALASTAAAALGAVTDVARPAAIAVLTRALEPTSRMARLVGTAGPRLPDLVVETVARTLITLGGAQGRDVVTRRAARERDPLRTRLLAALSEL